MEATPKKVILYETADDKCRFNEWLISLRYTRSRHFARTTILGGLRELKNG